MNRKFSPGNCLVFFLLFSGFLVLVLSVSCNSKPTESISIPPAVTAAPVTEQAVVYVVETAVSPDGGGTISLPGEGKYKAGSAVDVSAKPAAGYRFDHWEGDAAGSSLNVSLTMDSTKKITALFIRQFHLKTSVEPAGAGTVSPGGKVFDAGSSVTLTASPSEGYRFDKWSGAAENQNPELKITVDGDMDLVAHFVKQYKLNISIDPPNAGWVSPPAGNLDAGKNIELKASPNAGYIFDRWEGLFSNSGNPASFTMEADKSIVAHFMKSKLDMFEAVDKKLIKVTFQGTKFLNYVDMKLTSNTDKPFTLTLAVGTVLASAESRVQRMAVTVPLEYPLETLKTGGTATAKVYVFSLDMGKDVANATQTLDLSTEKLSGDLKTLFEYPLLTTSYYSVAQYAIWTIRENPNDKYGYWPINTAYPTIEQIKMIRDLFKAAGIPVDNYRVFKNMLGNE